MEFTNVLFHKVFQLEISLLPSVSSMVFVPSCHKVSHQYLPVIEDYLTGEKE